MRIRCSSPVVSSGVNPITNTSTCGCVMQPESSVARTIAGNSLFMTVPMELMPRNVTTISGRGGSLAVKLASLGKRESMATYDVVIYGATGFTGRQAARYFANRAPDAQSLRWAIAGRNREKLELVHRSLPSDVGLIVADAKDTTAIDALVASTRVVLTTAGPYAAFGEPLLRACATRGVDYVDITGETAHVRRMIDRYHDAAKHSGARIVPFCGFDSIPSDLGVLLLVEHFRSRGVGTREVKGFFRVIGGLNGGTA